MRRKNIKKREYCKERILRRNILIIITEVYSTKFTVLRYVYSIDVYSINIYSIKMYLIKEYSTEEYSTHVYSTHMYSTDVYSTNMYSTYVDFINVYSP